jgi:hypothetical protein
MPHLNTFKVGDRRFDQFIYLENDETAIIECSADLSADGNVIMTVTANAEVVVAGQIIGHFMMSRNDDRLYYWTFASVSGDIVIPFEQFTGHDNLIKSEVELAKYFIQRNLM